MLFYHKFFTCFVLLTTSLFLTPSIQAQVYFEQQNLDVNFTEAISVQTADVDGDGDIDLLGAAYQPDDIAWWENQGLDANGQRIFTKHVIDTRLYGADAVFAADLNGDKHLDIVATAFDVNTIVWYENDGHQNFTRKTVDASFNKANYLYVADVNGDKHNDIIATAYGANSIAWWKNDGTGNFTKIVIDNQLLGANGVFVEDIDKDGKVDILANAQSGNALVCYKSVSIDALGYVSFQKYVIDNQLKGAFWNHAIDVDGDNDVDILAAAREGNTIAWYENRGNMSFTKHTIKANFNGACSVQGIDIDNDGDTDIVGAAYKDNTLMWWENDGDEHFTPHVISDNFGYVYSMVVNDIDLDGKPDILAAAYQANTIAWWEHLSPEIQTSVSELPKMVANTEMTSHSQSFSLSANDLSEDLTLKVSDNTFEISLDGVLFSDQLTIAKAADRTIANTTILVRLKAGLTSQEEPYKAKITLSSTGAKSIDISLTGSVVNPDKTRGNALQFNGVQAYALTDIEFSGQTSFAFSLWFKPESIQTKQGLVSQTSGDNLLYFNNGLLASDFGGITIVATQLLNVQQWYQAVLTWDGTELQMFLNGKLAANSVVPTGTNTGKIALGVDQSLGNAFFAGQIDEFRLWNKAISQADIRNNLHLTLTGIEDGLEAYFQFNSLDEDNELEVEDQLYTYEAKLIGGTILTASSAVVAFGKSQSMQVNTAGSYKFEEVALQLDLGASPQGEIVVYYLEDTPFAPTLYVNGFNNHHWVIENFGQVQDNLQARVFFKYENGVNIEAGAFADYTLQTRGTMGYEDWSAIKGADTVSTSSDNQFICFTVQKLQQFHPISNSFSLPIELTNFEATRSQEKVILKWQTLQEIQNVGFEIEKSIDGKDFQKIDFVKGAGNSKTIQTYQIRINNSQAAYYRLKQIDSDGKYSYSRVLFVEGYTSTMKLSIYPNPTTEKVQIQLNHTSNKEVTLQVFATTGKHLLQQQGNLSAANQALNQQIKNWDNGVYVLKVTTHQKVFTRQLVIRR